MALTSKSTPEVAALLNEHTAASVALDRAALKRTGFDFTVTVGNLKDDSDFVSVSIDKSVARQALNTQLADIERKLKAFGIEIER